MKFHFISFSDQNFRLAQDALHAEVLSYDEFESVTSYSREYVQATEFYENHKILLEEKRGSGWCSWKPYLIKKKILEIPDGDCVVYLDAADALQRGITGYLKQILENEDCLLLNGGYQNSAWTKRDTFVAMKCDKPRFWNAQQLEAGFQVWKNCENSLKMLQLYLEWSLNRVVVTDEIFFFENFPEYQDHRYDQSVLTNISVMFDLPVDGPGLKYCEARKYVTCNVRG